LTGIIKLDLVLITMQNFMLISWRVSEISHWTKNCSKT